MAAITKTVNNVVCTINPAVFQSSGPSGQFIEFTSKIGVGISSPISIAFDRGVTIFSIVAVGLSNIHNAVGYNADGKIVAATSTLPSNPDRGSGGGVQTITLRSNTPIRRIILRPFLDYVGYRDLEILEVESTDAPATTLTRAPTSPPIYVPPVLREIDLYQVVEVDTSLIDRQYVKGTMNAPDPVTIKIRNTSPEVSVTISLVGIAGVTFTPAQFDIPILGEREIQVTFDAAQLEQLLPEGVSTLNTVINISSRDVIVEELPPPIEQTGTTLTFVPGGVLTETVDLLPSSDPLTSVPDGIITRQDPTIPIEESPGLIITRQDSISPIEKSEGLIITRREEVT